MIKKIYKNQNFLIFLIFIIFLFFLGFIFLVYRNNKIYKVKDSSNLYNLPKVDEETEEKRILYPTRIFSLSPSATEILYGINASKQIIAVDKSSDYPKNAPITPILGFVPIFEQIIKYKPDLVIINNTAINAVEVINKLNNMNIKTYLEKTPNNLDDIYKEIFELGKITGKEEESKNLVEKMKKNINNIIIKFKKYKNINIPIKFFHEIDDNLYTATSKTFVGNVYSTFGLINIADKAPIEKKDGYIQLDKKYIVESNPDLIFLGDGVVGEKYSLYIKKEGWDKINAIKNNKVIILPLNISARWGPRIVDFYETISNILINIINKI